MVLIHTEHNNRTIAMRIDVDVRRFIMHVGTMDGGSIIPDVTVEMRRDTLAYFIEHLQSMLEDLPK